MLIIDLSRIASMNLIGCESRNMNALATEFKFKREQKELFLVIIDSLRKPVHLTRAPLSC